MGKYLIFGGNGGIGSAIARTLAADGHALHLARRNAERLTAIASELGAGFTAGDVLSDGVIEETVAEAGDDLAGLVFAVGSINLKPLAKCS